ncbi:uncharacterized protein LAESUDRAFT_700574 [Laetiporus sulphureus 93-53]|uniref:Uncharacterized protein n=1 Tax=Laetiporus sulphureus 93-53 TaxID=1314785 RepID=A0A165E543_9APHY|nr:uncharacterized protein LAESUDRAFT_700574 [Laetiporus sulphureus 93-53]KZT06254.1 hypothetical protein LAESUDRAFT_700574 [Laetiporus sulphureus 93-53]
MARATRSSGQADKDKLQEPPASPRKTASKKRKRNSDNDDPSVPKQPRIDGSPEPEGPQPGVSETSSTGSGDKAIDASDAQKILDVLEVIDTQGLLDRVFPLSAETLESASTESAASTSATSQTYSLRALLKNPSRYPLRVLRSAVQHLFPISSHPRSLPSSTVAQQLRFCNLALSLLDSASIHSLPQVLDVESIFPTLFSPSTDVDEPQSAKTASASPTLARKRKYALVQRLPTGDWWTSLNSDFTPAFADDKALKDLPAGYAELAAILPSASTSTTKTEKTLAAYAPRRSNAALNQLPGPRRVSCGRFLDYGPYASFAPSFDQDGMEVGRDALGEVIWQREERTRLRSLVKGKQKALPPSVIVESSRITEGQSDEHRTEEKEELDTALESLLPRDEVAAIKSALGSLELEEAVQQLLDKNARALQRLHRMQRERLGRERGVSSTVEEGSEEWTTAQAIIDSLTLLASLRPRSSSDDGKEPPLVPPPSVLHALQRTLPIGATQGWYGTLPAGHTTALKDDTTVKLKPGVTVSPATTATAAAAATTLPTKTSTTPYAGYNYPNYPSQYRGGYGTYTPGQASGYYSNYPTIQGQTAPSTHYPSSQYNASGQYGYGSWYNYQQNQPGSTTGGSTSGRATPQQAASPTNVAANYASFFASTTQQQSQPQRAVANTVASVAAGTKNYQSGTYAAGQSGYTAPTLPAHLRSGTGGSSTPIMPRPSTPGTGSATPAYSSQSYFGNLPATAQSATR